MGPITFAMLATLLIAAALTVVLHRNPVKSALALIVTLFLLAVVFVFLEAHMIAALQIIVYTGAIMVLFLFVIMLLNLQEEPADAPGPFSGLRPLAWLGGAVLALELGWLVMRRSLGTMPAAPEGYGGALAVARSLFTDFVLPFELTSILLLVAVVGPVILAQRKKR